MIFPNLLILTCVCALVVVDLISGIMKSTSLGVATMSEGLKKSAQKLGTYLTLITTSLILANLALIVEEANELYMLISLNFLCSGFVYLETKSILENLIIANTNKDGERNDVANFLVIIHNSLILKFKNLTEFNYNETKKDVVRKLRK